MAIFSRETFDHPLVFSIAITLVVIFWMGVRGWGLTKMRATGPLGVVKGGVMLCVQSTGLSSR
jgi:hypothetical protein